MKIVIKILAWLFVIWWFLINTGVFITISDTVFLGKDLLIGLMIMPAFLIAVFISNKFFDEYLEQAKFEFPVYERFINFKIFMIGVSVLGFIIAISVATKESLIDFGLYSNKFDYKGVEMNFKIIVGITDSIAGIFGSFILTAMWKKRPIIKPFYTPNPNYFKHDDFHP
jgi:hypothetical protein